MGCTKDDGIGERAQGHAMNMRTNVSQYEILVERGVFGDLTNDSVACA